MARPDLRGRLASRGALELPLHGSCFGLHLRDSFGGGGAMMLDGRAWPSASVTTGWWPMRLECAPLALAGQTELSIHMALSGRREGTTSKAHAAHQVQAAGQCCHQQRGTPPEARLARAQQRAAGRAPDPMPELPAANTEADQLENNKHHPRLGQRDERAVDSRVMRREPRDESKGEGSSTSSKQQMQKAQKSQTRTHGLEIVDGALRGHRRHARL